jgi:hypothetical protein
MFIPLKKWESLDNSVCWDMLDNNLANVLEETKQEVPKENHNSADEHDINERDQIPKTVKNDPEVELNASVDLNTLNFGKIDGLELDDVGEDDFEFFKPSPTEVAGGKAVESGLGSPTTDLKTFSTSVGLFSPQYYSVATPFGASPSPRTLDHTSPGLSPGAESAVFSPTNYSESFRSPNPDLPMSRTSPDFIPISTPKSSLIGAVRANSEKMLRLDFQPESGIFDCPNRWLPFQMRLDHMWERSKYAENGRWKFSPSKNHPTSKFKISKSKSNSSAQPKIIYSRLQPCGLKRLYPIYDFCKILIPDDARGSLKSIVLWESNILMEYLYQIREKSWVQSMHSVQRISSVEIIDKVYQACQDLIPGEKRYIPLEEWIESKGII